MTASRFRKSLSVGVQRITRAVSPSGHRRGQSQSTAGPSQTAPPSAQSTVSGLHLSTSSQLTVSSQRPVTPGNTRNSFTPDPALKNAIEQRAAELSDHDKTAFQSAGDIMDKIRIMDQANASSLSRSCGARVEKILQCMKHFVDSVAICIQHNPEISSLVVGGVRCVLLLVLGYIEFFESLTRMMERIGGHLRYLSEYGSRVFQGSPDVQEALVSTYCDLLDFFVAVRGVFTDKEGNASYLKSFKLFMKLTWEPFESKFKPIEDRFLDHTLVVVRSAGVQDLVAKYENSLQIRQKENSEKRREILQWLSPIDFEETHQRHFKKHFPNTGQWLLGNPLFPSWKDTKGSSLLWCHGMPGTGKTVLASLVVEKLSAQYELSNDTGLCFVYCNYKEPHDTATYVKVAIKQLCRRMSELPVELESFYDRHYRNASNPGYSELQGLFTEVSKHFGKVFLVLDALDECPEDQRRELFEVLQGIASCTGNSHGNSKLFITSRKEPDIKRAFGNFPVIEIEAKKVDADIELYVTAQLDKYLQDGTLRIQDNSLRHKILTALVSKAGGMFLWIEFQLKHICSQTSDHDIEEALERLPEDIEQTYERIIDLINKKPKSQRNLARSALMWVAYARRPLMLGELVSAVAMENGTRSYETLRSKIPTADTLFDVCANLIARDDSNGRFSTVRFVHFSVQEFLLEKSLDQNNTSAMATLNINLQLAHAEIARMCINFLLFCGRHRPPDVYDYTGLVTYATDAWSYHVRAVTRIDDDLMKLLLEFFGFGVFLELKYGILWENSLRPYNHIASTKFSPLTVSLIFDLPIVSKYLEKEHQNQHPYPEDSYAMHYAARQNSCKAVERLHRQEFCVDELDSDGCTPLYYSSGKEVAKLLLDSGADVNAQGGQRGNALQAAACGGKKEVVQLLLDSGADVDAQGGYYRNALQAAAFHGKKEVMQLLLDSGADVNAQGGPYGNALQAAAYGGKKEVVQLLLDSGADVNAQGGSYGNALQAAAWSGEEEVVQLLLDSGADINAKGGSYGNALQAAAYDTKKEVVQLLLDSGAHVNAQGGQYGNALQAAALRGEKEVVQLLLDSGADLNAQGGSYANALQAAVCDGKKEVVQLLLDSGADVNAQGGPYGNALQAAAYDGKKEVVQLLLDSGADVNAQGGSYGNALQAATDPDISKLLIENGAV